MNSINAKAQADMFRFILKGKGAIQKITKQVLLEVGYRLVARSPVGDPSLWTPPYWPKGYIPGDFINNWQLGVDVIPNATYVSGPNELGSDSYTRFAKLPRWAVGHVYYFVNNLPYAMMLERGHSSQAPIGIVGLTVLEYPEIVRQAEINYSKADD